MATKEELLGTGTGSIDEVIKIAPDGVPLDPTKTQGRKHRQLLKDMLEVMPATFTTIAEDAYGTHPEFTTQHDLNVWLLENTYKI
jgi:hypothetical protein